MNKVKHALIFMGLGALGATMFMKMMDIDVDDIIKKEKKMIKNFKSKFMC